MLLWLWKEKTNAIREIHAVGDYLHAALGRDIACAGRDDNGCVPSAIDQQADLLPLALGIWWVENRLGAANWA
jgi:hypothetical protein